MAARKNQFAIITLIYYLSSIDCIEMNISTTRIITNAIMIAVMVDVSIFALLVTWGISDSKNGSHSSRPTR